MESAAIFVNAHKAENSLLLHSTTNQYIDGDYLLCQFTYHHFLCRYCVLMHQWCKTARCAKWLIKLQKNWKEGRERTVNELKTHFCPHTNRKMGLWNKLTLTSGWRSWLSSNFPGKMTGKKNKNKKTHNTIHQDCALFSALRIVWQFMWTTGLIKEHQDSTEENLPTDKQLTKYNFQKSHSVRMC